MLKYNPNLREPARQLRRAMTEAERSLWARLRRKQVLGIQFYRQKPIGNFIVDFYAPAAALVVELDGRHHFQDAQMGYDEARTEYLCALGLHVLRFSNSDVFRQLDAVVENIATAIRTDRRLE